MNMKKIKLKKKYLSYKNIFLNLKLKYFLIKN